MAVDRVLCLARPVAGTSIREVVRRAGALPVVLTLLVLVMAAAAMSGPQITHLPLPSVNGEAADSKPEQAPDVTVPTPTTPPTGDRPEVSGWAMGLTVLLVVIGLLVVAGIGWLLVRTAMRLGTRSARGRPEPDDAELLDEIDEYTAVDPEIRDAVDAGIDQLDDESDPRRAVIGCWLRLESAAERAGMPRHPEDTPSDLVSRMLANRSISTKSLTRLAELYERARYGPASVDEGMRVEARETLAQLRNELVGPAQPTPADPAAESAPADEDAEQAR